MFLHGGIERKEEKKEEQSQLLVGIKYVSDLPRFVGLVFKCFEKKLQIIE